MISPTFPMFENMDGQSSVYITASKEVPTNAEDGNHMSICIDQVIASVLGKSESLEEAIQHVDYIRSELALFRNNLRIRQIAESKAAE
jgi:hypothetical protein